MSMFRFVFFLCLVFCIPSFSVDKFKKEYQETKQTFLPPCFGYFENLYLDAFNQTFLTCGRKIHLKQAIDIDDKDRGFTWHKVSNAASLTQLGKRFFHIPGLTLIVLEPERTFWYSNHFFHFLEHLLGLWNFGGEDRRDDVKLFLFADNGSKKFPPHWQGHNDITFHLIKALFPNAQIKLWPEFLKEYPKHVVFSQVMTSDRSFERLKREPYYTERMLGEYFLYLSKESIDHLASAVYDYCGTHDHHTDKLVITYVVRPYPRRLTEDLEKQLLDRIEQLSHVELRVVDFASMSFKEQVDCVAHTDVLLSAHGNGLSHTLFLPKGSTLIELFPRECLRVEYRIFAQLRGVHYFGMIPNRGWISDQEAIQLGCFGDHNVSIDEIDVDAIISTIQSTQERLNK